MSKRVKITVPNGDIFRFDAVFNQDVTSNLILTSYPVQDGSPVTDHAYKEPEYLSMRVKVSDIKLSIYDNSFDDVNSRGEKAFEILQTWQKEVFLLKVQTKFKLLTNMVLVGVQNIVNSSKNSNVFEAILTFRKLRIARIEEISAGPFENGNSAAYESPYQNNGNVQGQLLEDEVIDIAGATMGGVLGGASVGAAIGGIIGTIIPGAGTIAGAAIGAGIGAIVGGAYGFLTSTFGKD